MCFEKLWLLYAWKPIPGCSGRYLLKGGCSSLPPDKILGGSVEITVHYQTTAPDPVFVAMFDGGGLISYGKADGGFIHTLNDPAGMQKKLTMLGIAADGKEEGVVF